LKNQKRKLLGKQLAKGRVFLHEIPGLENIFQTHWVVEISSEG